MTNLLQFELPFKNKKELRLYVWLAFGVRIPNKRVCEHHCTPWEAFCDAYFAKEPVAVWKASRGFGGKSFLLALLAMVEATTLKADVNVLGGSGEQSRRVLEYSQAFWNVEGAPYQLLDSDVKGETRLRWGNKVKALMASQASVRGPHPQRLRMDEIDEMEIDILDAALGQPMASITYDVDGRPLVAIPSQTVLSSTHQYADRTMTEVLNRAADRGWPVYEWCYRETQEPHGWLLKSEIESKKKTVTRIMWLTEYDLQEPSPESRAIAPDLVELMFNPILGDVQGENGTYYEFIPPQCMCKACETWYSVDIVYVPKGNDEDVEYRPGNMVLAPSGSYVSTHKWLPCPNCNKEDYEMASYSTGADWAKKRDCTVIVTLRTDVEPYQVVAFERCSRLPWPSMVGKFNSRIERYGGNGTHDSTGLGSVVDDLMEYAVIPIAMVGRKRQDLFSDYIKAIERQEIVAPRVNYMYREHKMCSVDNLYRGGGHPPDSVVAGALAYEGAGAGRFIY